MKLQWSYLPGALNGIDVWAARDGAVDYVIGLEPTDRTYFLSVKMDPLPVDDLGDFDTLEEAQAAAETARGR